jgi:hypothetical protein
MLYMWHAWDKPLLVTAVSLELFTRQLLAKEQGGLQSQWRHGRIQQISWVRRLVRCMACISCPREIIFPVTGMLVNNVRIGI